MHWSYSLKPATGYHPSSAVLLIWKGAENRDVSIRTSIYANKLNVDDNILNPDLKPQYSLTRPGSKESEAIGKMMRDRRDGKGEPGAEGTGSVVLG
ncbi:hypothetical protein AE1304_04230 [Aeromonas enteropelogenes]